MAGIALFGVIAYRSMPVSDLPTVDYPTISVSASLPGADPNTMSSSVASVLERQFTGIAGLDSMTSRSSTGSTNISLQFSLDRDIEGAAVDVQSAIAAVTPLLPAGLPAPPSFRKQNPSEQPIIFLSLISSGHYVLASLGVLYSVFGLYYYLKIANAMFMREAEKGEEKLPISLAMGAALTVTGFATLYIGILPNQFIELANWALGIAQNPDVAKLIH